MNPPIPPIKGGYGFWLSPKKVCRKTRPPNLPRQAGRRQGRDGMSCAARLDVQRGECRSPHGRERPELWVCRNELRCAVVSAARRMPFTSLQGLENSPGETGYAYQVAQNVCIKSIKYTYRTKSEYQVISSARIKKLNQTYK